MTEPVVESGGNVFADLRIPHPEQYRAKAELAAQILKVVRRRGLTQAAAGKLLGLDDDEVMLLQEVPYRGSLPTAVPTDPLIYRFYELVQVYGTTWKALIQEEEANRAAQLVPTIPQQPINDPSTPR